MSQTTFCSSSYRELFVDVLVIVRRPVHLVRPVWTAVPLFLKDGVVMSTILQADYHFTFVVKPDSALAQRVEWFT